MQDLPKLPEWKQLYQSLHPLLPSKRLFTYAELSEIAGIDLQSMAGRRQFIRFRDQALKDWQVWFENERSIGYRVVDPKEHGLAANRQMSRAYRRVKMAGKILVNTKIEELTGDQRKAHAHQLSCTGAIAQAFRDRKKEIRQAALSAAGTIPFPSFTKLLP